MRTNHKGDLMEDDLINVTAARRELFSIVDQVDAGEVGPVTVVSRNGAAVVIVSREEWKAIQETLYVDQHFPHLKEDIRESETRESRKRVVRASDLGY